MATSKSRTKPAGEDAPVAKKKSKPSTARKAAPASRKAALKADDAAPAVRRKSARRAAAAAPEEPIDEEALEASVGSKAAGKNLVIVESPTKSKTLHKFLGKDFMVLASNGHVMDLPKSQLGVDVDNDFEPVYELIATKRQVVAKIRAAAKHAAMIYLAPDPDREGEAIACHLATLLKGTKRPIRRLTFNEITQRAVTDALKRVVILLRRQFDDRFDPPPEVQGIY